jgi:hypothetical protein
MSIFKWFCPTENFDARRDSLLKPRSQAGITDPNQAPFSGLFVLDLSNPSSVTLVAQHPLDVGFSSGKGQRVANEDGETRPLDRPRLQDNGGVFAHALAGHQRLNHAGSNLVAEVGRIPGAELPELVTKLIPSKP